MTNIITNYLAREILKTSCATLLVLYVILVSNAFGRVLADIADGDVPQQALWPVLLGQAVNLLSVLLPIALFLGIVFTFGRMYKDHEIVVMNACGIGYREFYRPVLLATAPFLIVSIYTSVWLNAQVLSAGQAAIDSEQNRHEFQLIKPGQFNQNSGGDLVFFMESMSEDRQELQDIIINQGNGDAMVIETARRGRQEIDDKSGDLFLVIGPGERHEGRAGDNRHKIISYDEHGILMQRISRGKSGEVHSKQMTPQSLLQSEKMIHLVEMHWRVAVPVTLLVLALLAVPLSYIAPRQGRYGKVGPALLVFIVYLNLLAFTRSQLEDEVIPVVINYWWVHLLFLLLTVTLLYRRNHGVLSRRAST